MKNTGVVRKIDNLGRIVIPKEIRKNLNIHNGDDVQIFVEEDKIVLKKYQKVLSVKENAQKFIIKFSKMCLSDIIITDKEKIIAGLECYIDKSIDNKIIMKIDERKQDSGHNINIGGEVLEKYYYMIPIIVDADAIGAVVMISDREINDKDKTIAEVLNLILCMEFY